MYYDFSLPVKQTSSSSGHPRMLILICSCSYMIVELKLYHFIALSANICYLHKHRRTHIWDYMHKIKIKNHRGPFQLPAAILGSILNFPLFAIFKMTSAGFENYGST